MGSIDHARADIRRRDALVDVRLMAPIEMATAAVYLAVIVLVIRVYRMRGE